MMWAHGQHNRWSQNGSSQRDNKKKKILVGAVRNSDVDLDCTAPPCLTSRHSSQWAVNTDR